MRYTDKDGTDFVDCDVVKVFHFVGARRKKHYMYKRIRHNDKGQICFEHLCNPSLDLVPLIAVCRNVDGVYVWLDAEIVQGGED